MEWALKNGEYEQPKLSLEDLFLNFPDKSITGLSDLKKRGQYFPNLEKIPYRFFITVGHSKGKASLKENINYLKSKRVRFNFIYKPISGIYPLKEQLRLEKIKIDKEKYVKNFLQSYKKVKIDKEIEGGHSSPGRLLIIAEYLTQRAEVLLNNAITVEDAIHGAVLALEAKELLGYRTPTTTLEALALQHQLEVLAECMFYGVEYHFDVKKRVEEIEKEVKTIGKWFNVQTRERSEINAILSITGNLVNIFRNFNQFDEEMECLHFIRKLHRKLLLRRNKLFIFIYPIVFYIETLLSSLPLFILALIFWPIFWGVLCYCFGNKDLFYYIAHSFFTFFGLQPIQIENEPHFVILIYILETICGFLHLGIFISYIFDLIMRK